jgi:hypothetical protein
MEILADLIPETHLTTCASYAGPPSRLNIHFTCTPTMIDTTDYVTWIFPRPSLPLPRLPHPSGDMSLARWYLEYSLINETSAMTSKFRYEAGFKTGDTLEPYWVDGPDSMGDSDAVNILRLFCLRCDDATQKYPCKAGLNSTTDMVEVAQTFNISAPASRYRIKLPEPDDQVYGDIGYSSLYTCTLQRESSLDKRVTDLDRQAFSEVFFVSTFTGISSLRSVYNVSNSGGVPFRQADEEQADVPAFVFPPAGALTNLYETESLSWPSSKRIQDAMGEMRYEGRDGVGPVFQMPANIQADDILEPRWIEHPNHPAKSLGLACIMCPEKNGTRLHREQHCTSFRGSKARKLTEFYLPIEFHSPGGAGVEVRMPSSRSSETVAACAFHLGFSTPSGAEVVVSSRVFFVADGASMRREQHRFNLTRISGAPTGMNRGVLSDSTSTDFYSRFGSNHGSRKLSPGAIAGIVLGSIAICVLALLLWKCWRRKAKKMKMGNSSAPSQTERDAVLRSEADVHLPLQPRGKSGASTSLLQLGTRPNTDTMGVAHTESRTEESVPEPPPAYYKVVNNSR